MRTEIPTGSGPLLPRTRAWVHGHLAADERVTAVEPLHGGFTARVLRLTVSAADGGTRALVLRSFVVPERVATARDALEREAHALTELADGAVTAPGLVGVDAAAAHCEHPSLLMTHLPGRPLFTDDGVAARVPLLARQLVRIHAVRPARRPREAVTLTTADTVVTPPGADEAVWAAAREVIRGPRPAPEHRFLHRDFQPGNVLFSGSGPVEVAGVVDWATASWGPADLDVAHCAVNLALLHGPSWGLRFVEEYERAGGVLAADPADRRYWLVRDAMASSEEVDEVSGQWRGVGRPDLTARVVGERLDAYVRILLGTAPEVAA
ncbi:MAG TPA: aminoglycoside phosphotransferase family protein [Promicromonospora sp.]|nr:aminoglycoside phosphotransferase family protein [Promicromonospora sp.]